MGVNYAAVVCFLALAKGLAAPLALGDDRQVQQDPCRVAVSISGDPRSFADPIVHRSFRRYVIEAIEKSDCQVHVFAYGMLEDDLDFLLADEVGCRLCRLPVCSICLGGTFDNSREWTFDNSRNLSCAHFLQRSRALCPLTVCNPEACL